MKFIPSFHSFIDRLFIVAGAFLGSQIPPFMHQYSQRLSGHVAELERLLDQLRIVASHSNKSLNEYIQKFLSSSDPDFVSQGKFMHGMVDRWENLNSTLSHLSQSSGWMKPIVFLKELHSDIAQATVASFHPAINLTLEGLCYAGLGCLFGWAIFLAFSKLCKFIYTSGLAICRQGFYFQKEA